jgi:alkanesulfonate monooxygenase SsuD/methylene tetrahydromethanopterin reductase-like flavin-dependent oxidoreductase (luciferase family)
MVSISDCGLMLEPQEGMAVEEIVEWAEYAERSGYGYLFRSDHLLPTFPRAATERSVDSPECWTTLGAVAAKTSKIRFGPMVSPLGFRNPALLGRMARTLHGYSRGRLVLGVGAGWYPEALGGIIEPLAKGKAVDHKGKYYEAHLERLPELEHGNIRLIVGGQSKGIARLAANFADEWNLFSPSVDAIPGFKDLLNSERQAASGSDRAISKAKRDTIAISQMGSFFIAEAERELEDTVKPIRRNSDEDPKAIIARLRSRGIICALADDFLAELAARNKAGVDRFYFQLTRPREQRGMVELLTKILRAHA